MGCLPFSLAELSGQSATLLAVPIQTVDRQCSIASEMPHEAIRRTTFGGIEGVSIVMKQPSPEVVSSAIEILRPLVGTIALPVRGSGWGAVEDSWFRLVGQICAIGNSRAWEALEPVQERLTIPRIRAEGEQASVYVHGILAELRIRYCSLRSTDSAKAIAIAANAFSPFIADANGVVCLLDRIQEAVGAPGTDGLLTPEQTRLARRLLIREVRFFGPKSASDFLLGLGLADNLLAFDVRLLNLLIDFWDFDPAWRDRVHRLDLYEALETEIVERFCKPLDISPVALDRLLFYGYPELRKSAKAPTIVSVEK
ncbi:MAG: N-glycosylase/DNA lyase [Chthonomonadales bacterium]|nr:N-glycosylase/DNA lyase [Chthonomonadales bacterium]